jgi:hypothetical protein
MSTTIGNLTISATLHPTTLLEVRIKTAANFREQWSNITPSHTVPFAELESVTTMLDNQTTCVKYAWNILGDNSFYEHAGPAGRTAAAYLGSLGGKSTSEAKRKASAANGKLGGRGHKREDRT